MSVLSSVSLLLTLFLLPVASVAEVAENQVKETVQECQQVQEQTEDWRLLLVNGWSPMPEEYEVTLKKLPGGLQVDERVYDDLTAMLADCGKAGLHPIVCSAYRDMETQTRLHKNKIAWRKFFQREVRCLHFVALPQFRRISNVSTGERNFRFPSRMCSFSTSLPTA